MRLLFGCAIGVSAAMLGGLAACNKSSDEAKQKDPAGLVAAKKDNDGMAFYRSINRKVEDNPVAFIEAGCPLGTGDFGNGSIGYWLKPEISQKHTHQEGVLGACQNRDPNSAACRFYLTANAMPRL